MTARGRKPRPTHLKLVEGNPGKRPLNKREPKPRQAAKIPAPPAHLNETAKAEWKQIAAELHRSGLLTTVDRAALAAYCQAYARWAQAEQAIGEMAKRDNLTGGLMIKTTNGNAVQNPLVGTANKAMADMVRYATEFGMTPSARSRIHGEGDSDEEDPADKYM